MLHLALDPNLCIAASCEHPHSSGLLRDIREDRDYLKLVIDKNGVILREYEDLLEVLPEVQRKWLLWILENKHSLLKKLAIPNFPMHEPALCNIGCGTPVEPQLLSLCWEHGSKVKLLVVGTEFRHEDLRTRGVHSEIIIEQLRHDLGIDVVVWDALRARRAIADHIKYEPLWPHNELELDTFLKENRFEENDQLEFKQPNNEDRSRGFHLTKSILEAVMKEICGFANAYGGRVILGIAEDREHNGIKMGFTLEYKSRRGMRPKSRDEIMNILATDPRLLSNFEPQITDILRYDMFPLSNGRYVLVFHIEKAEFECYYGNSMYCRYGCQTKLVK